MLEETHPVLRSFPAAGAQDTTRVTPITARLIFNTLICIPHGLVIRCGTWMCLICLRTCFCVFGVRPCAREELFGAAVLGVGVLG